MIGGKGPLMCDAKPCMLSTVSSNHSASAVVQIIATVCEVQILTALTHIISPHKKSRVNSVY